MRGLAVGDLSPSSPQVQAGICRGAGSPVEGKGGVSVWLVLPAGKLSPGKISGGIWGKIALLREWEWSWEGRDNER